MTDAWGFEDFAARRAGELQRSAWLLTGDWAAADELVRHALGAAAISWQQLVLREGRMLFVRRELVRRFLRTHGGFSEEPGLLARLAPRQRAALVLVHHDGLSETDAAAAIGCRVSRLQDDLATALSRLSVPVVGGDVGLWRLLSDAVADPPYSLEVARIMRGSSRQRTLRWLAPGIAFLFLVMGYFAILVVARFLGW